MKPHKLTQMFFNCNVSDRKPFCCYIVRETEPSSSKPDSSPEKEEENVSSQKSSKSGEQLNLSERLQRSVLLIKSVELSQFQ